MTHDLLAQPLRTEHLLTSNVLNRSHHDTSGVRVLRKWQKIRCEPDSFCRLRDVPWADYDLQSSRYRRENGGVVPYDLSVNGELQATRACLDPDLLRPGEEDPFFI